MSPDVLQALDQLQALLDGLPGGGRTKDSDAQVGRLPALYAVAVDALARARTDPGDSAHAERLNNLVARASRVMHRGVFRPEHDFLAWVRGHWLPALRGSRSCLCLAIVLYLAGFLVGFTSMSADSKIVRLIVPPENMAQVDRILSDQAPGTGGPELLSLTLLRYHLGSAALALAGGFFLGIAPAVMLLWAGLMVGSLATVHVQAGFASAFFWWFAWCAFLGHAMLILASAAGFELAQGFCFPGLLGRAQALKVAGIRVAALLLPIGVMALLDLAQCVRF